MKPMSAEMGVFGRWKGTVGYVEGRNVLLDSRHQSPLKVAKPFTGTHGELQILLMDASPGLFNGDRQEICVELEKESRLFLTNQSSCKLHPSRIQARSRQRQMFICREDSFLEYMPEPVIPYRGADHEMITEIHLEQGAQAMIGEILAPGRTGYGETFAYERVRSSFSVYWDGTWTVWDSMRFEPRRWGKGRAPFGEYAYFGSFWILSERDKWTDPVRLRKVFSSILKDDPSPVVYRYKPSTVKRLRRPLSFNVRCAFKKTNACLSYAAA